MIPPLTDAQVCELAERAAVHPSTIMRRMLGLPVAGKASTRADAVLGPISRVTAEPAMARVRARVAKRLGTLEGAEILAIIDEEWPQPKASA